MKYKERNHKRLWFFIEKFPVIVVVIFFLVKMSIYKKNFVNFFESIYCVFDWDSINILDNISISKEKFTIWNLVNIENDQIIN